MTGRGESVFVRCFGPSCRARHFNVSSSIRRGDATTLPATMSDMTEIWSGKSTGETFGEVLPGDSVLVNVHSQDKCAGRHCVLHNPSDHHMRDWPTLWRADLGIMERTCPHGIGHPDPDDLAFHKSLGHDWLSIHSCDLCCRMPE